MIAKRVLLAAVAALAGAAFPAAAQDEAARPSFDCQRASTPFEHAICADPELAAEDQLMARLYKEARAGAFGNGRSGWQASQRAWLAGREGQCRRTDGPDLLACRREVLKSRNETLATAILLSNPRLALPVLYRIDPVSAAVLEAIQIYASEPVDADWSLPDRAEKRARIAHLMEPWFDRMSDSEDAVYGRMILEDEGILAFEDAMKSGETFARFLNVASAYAERPVMPMIMPCEAIVRHPELIGATDAVFGSTLDNFTFATDCSEALPPTPAFGRLTDTVSGLWPPCTGSLPFATFSSFGQAIDAARLGLPVEVDREGATGRLPVREDIAPRVVGAAVDELERHYRVNGRVPESDARVLALEHVRAAMSYKDMGC